MTVVPLPARTARGPVRSLPRPVSAEVRLSFEVVLGGDTRYTDALEVIDGVRLVTERVGAAALTVGSGRPAAAVPTAMAELPVDRTAIRIYPGMRSISLGAEPVELTKLEYDLMLFLAEHPRTGFTRLQLLQGVWGHLHAGVRTVDVHIRRLRAKLRDDLVITVRGVGYRLADNPRVRIVRTEGVGGADTAELTRTVGAGRERDLTSTREVIEEHGYGRAEPRAGRSAGVPGPPPRLPRYTVQGLTEEQAAKSPTASQLCLGGLIKHVAQTEQGWMRFAVGGAEAMEAESPDFEAGFRMEPGDTLADLLARYDEVARETNELVTTLDLDHRTRCPVAPWTSRARAGRCGGWCCTSSPRPRSTPAMPTSSGRRSTVRRRWASRTRPAEQERAQALARAWLWRNSAMYSSSVCRSPAQLVALAVLAPPRTRSPLSAGENLIVPE